MRAFEYREPDNLEEVLALLHDHGEDAKIIAGGTALVIMLNQRLIKPSYLISLRKLSALNSVESVDGVLQLGALVTHRDMETSPVIRDRVPVTLMALDARVRLTSNGGSREIPLDEFFIDYYETVLQSDAMLTHVLVPVPKPLTGSIYLKFLPRTEDDYAAVGVAVSVVLEPSSQLCRDCRIVLGGVAPTPLRVKEAEALLSGQKLAPQLLHKMASVAQEHTDPISDSRGSADYKREMAGVYVRRALEQAWQRALSRDYA